MTRRTLLSAVVVSVLALTPFQAPLAAQAGPQISRGPYLQMGTPTSIVVRWRTTAATDSVVEYGTDPANLTLTARVATVTNNHEVELSLLQPATKYYYAVGSTAGRLAGADANHFFVTAPPAGSASPTRIWVLGDSGTGEVPAQAVRDAYYTFTGTTFTNLWLMLGDNAYNGGLDSEYQAALFDIYPSTLRQSVLWPTKGNHDVTNSQTSGPYFDIFSLPKNGEAGGVASGTEAYYSFDYANIHFICLNSFDVDLLAGSPMMTWLQSDIASTTARWIIAYWHHPSYSKGSHDSDIDFELTQMRQVAGPILEAGGVDLVLSGHSHSYERSFLIDGHYGRSNTFNDSMKVDGGSGSESGTGAYRKPNALSAPHAGTVYAVAGSSGAISGGTLNHPAMFVSMNVLGSLVLDVNGGRLDVRFLDDHSVVRDSFSIVKDPVAPLAITTSALAAGAAGVAYQQTVAATGGRTPYAWSVVAGSLPAGVSLNAATGAISGTPTAPGTFNVTVRATDSSVPSVTAERQFSLVITGQVVVPNVVGLSQSAATSAIAGAGLTQGAITGAPSASVPIGQVISQTPAGGSQVAQGTAVALVISTGSGSPIVIGSRIAGSFADASGHSGQSHLFYAANAGVWWLLTLTSSADSQGGANHLVKAYRSSGADLASATWVAAADSPGAAASQSSNCGNCFMGSGRALGVAYLNNAPADVVHAEVAMAFDGQNGVTAHIRATVTATTIAWGSWSYYDGPAATWTLPRAVTLGVSGGRFIHSGGPTLQQEVDANVRVSINPDTGATWNSGFSAVSLIDNSMFHQSNSMIFAPLAGNRMLSVYDNGGGQAPCYGCQGGVPEPTLSNLGYRRSNPDGSWPTLPPGNQTAGDGKVFAADATIDQNDWTVVGADPAIRAFRRNAAGTGIDAAAYDAATNTWTAFAAPPLFGAGRAHKSGSGVFGVASGPRIWLFVIVTDAANSILYAKYEASAWRAWAPVPGTDSGSHARSFISGFPAAAAGQVGLVWTEGSTQYDLVTTSIPLTTTVPNLAGLTQAAAAAAIASAGLVSGTIATVSSATVPIGSVVSQNPPAFTQVAGGIAVDLVVSSGVVVPAVVGEAQSAAEALIAAVAGLAVGTVTTAASETVAPGVVISQAPAAGANASGGTRVDLVVSSGPPPPPVPAPGVVNMTQAEATAAITAAGLVVGAVTQASSLSVPAGVVLSQDPAAGTLVAVNGAVNLVVSSGVPIVTLPNLAGQTLAAATATLQNAGLVVGTTTNATSTTVPSGSVISQSPAAGTQVVYGSAVNLVVSSGPPPPVAVPNVVNVTQAQATSAITGAGFVVGAITTAPSATVPSGTVISQSPTAGTLATPGSAVSIVVSSGGALPSPIVDVVVFSDGNGVRTTSKFSTAATNELLLAFVSSDGPSPGAQTATVTGAGLTWTLVRRANTQAGTSEVWQAKAAARLTNVSVTSTQGVAGFRQSLTVVAFRGASGVGASAIASASTGAPSVTLATTKANALVYGVGNDWDRAVARTLGPSQVMVHQSVVTAVGDTFWVQSRSAAIAAAGTSVTINCTAPTNDRWNFVSVEIVP